MKVVRQAVTAVAYAGLAGSVTMLVRMVIVVAQGGSCGSANTPACSPVQTRALETMPISIGGLVFFILVLVFSKTLFAASDTLFASSGPRSGGGPPVRVMPVGGSQLVRGPGGTTIIQNPGGVQTPFGYGTSFGSPSSAAPGAPRWIVPATCPTCGAHVDQAAVQNDQAPSCAYCHSVLPVQPNR